jgi:type I site-specific restriction endonuclease
MTAARDTIEEGVRLLILEAGWNGSDVLAEEMVYYRGRVLTLDLMLLYRLYPLALVEVGPIGGPLEIGPDAAGYAAANGIPFVLAADGEHVLGMETGDADALAYPVFPAPTELWSALGRDPVEEDPRIYPPAELPDTRVTAPMALAVARALDLVVEGEKRILLAMAEETGQGPVALQIAWKLLGAGRCRHALYLVSGPEMVDYAKRLWRPFGDGATMPDDARPASEAEQVRVALIDAFYEGDEVSPAAEAALREYDLILMADAETRAGRESLLSYVGESLVVGFSDREPPSDEVSEFFGPPRFTFAREAELAIRAAAAEPPGDIFDELKKE